MTSHKAKCVCLSIPQQTNVLILVSSRTFFKKWLELERRLGNEDGEEVVKQKAVAWTQRADNND
jgi:hypothetical protein